MTKVFLDTNIIVYANDSADRSKQECALTLVRDVFRSRNGVISTQVLAEFASVARSRLHQEREAVTRQLLLLERLETVAVSGEIVRNALELAEVYGISFWDAMIVAAANAAHCDTLWSEDLSDGRLYGAVRVRNPFA